MNYPVLLAQMLMLTDSSSNKIQYQQKSKTMNTKSVLTIIISGAILFAACKKKKGDVPTLAPVAKKVYAVGYEQNSTGPYLGKYWVDTALTTISVSGSDVILFDVEVVGTDVYLFGEVEPQAGARKMSIWKNGTILYDNVSVNNFSPFRKTMVVNGTDIYLCGESFSTSAPTQRASIWKNGVVTNLPQNLSYSYASNIFVEGSNVYVLGRDYSSTQESIVVWKNGMREVLTECEQGQAIFAVGSDVYVAGNDINSKPAYWKNGVKTLLPIPSTSEAECSGIKVVGTDVYVSGNESIQNGTDIVVYWKNGIRTTLQTASANFNAESYGIEIDENNVYVYGYVERNSNGDYCAAYWKNGTLTNLTPTSTSGELFSVVVK